MNVRIAQCLCARGYFVQKQCMVFVLEEPNYVTPYLSVRFLGFLETISEHVPRTRDILADTLSYAEFYLSLRLILIILKINYFAVLEENRRSSSSLRSIIKQ